VQPLPKIGKTVAGRLRAAPQTGTAWLEKGNVEEFSL